MPYDGSRALTIQGRDERSLENYTSSTGSSKDADIKVIEQMARPVHPERDSQSVRPDDALEAASECSKQCEE